MEDVMLKLNRLYSLDTKTWTWYEPNVQGPKPVGRMFGSAVFLNNESYAVFAFGNSNAKFHEIHVLIALDLF